MQDLPLLTPARVDFRDQPGHGLSEISLHSFTASNSIPVRLSLLKATGVVDGSLAASEHIVVPFGAFCKHFLALAREVIDESGHVLEDALGEELREGGLSAYLSQVPVRGDRAGQLHPLCQGLGSPEESPLLLPCDVLEHVLGIAQQVLHHATTGQRTTRHGRFLPRDVNLWASASTTMSSCHYDEDDNVLFVLAGCKTVALAPPQAAEVAAFGAASVASASPNHASSDFLSPSLAPELQSYVRLVTLHAGQAVIIPSGWWHQVHSTAGTVALNVWAQHERDCPGQALAKPPPLSLTPVCSAWLQEEHKRLSSSAALARTKRVRTVRQRLYQEAMAFMSSGKAVAATSAAGSTATSLLSACACVLLSLSSSLNPDPRRIDDSACCTGSLSTVHATALDAACVQLASAMLHALAAPSVLRDWWSGCLGVDASHTSPAVALRHAARTCPSEALPLVCLSLAWEHLTDSHVDLAAAAAAGQGLCDPSGVTSLDTLFTVWWGALDLTPMQGARTVATAIEAAGALLLSQCALS